MYALAITQEEGNGLYRNVKKSFETATLQVFFKPMQTKHDGSRGAIPEYFGKRPISLRITPEILRQLEDIVDNSSSVGRFYLNVLRPLS
jgi:hypothetical protein